MSEGTDRAAPIVRTSLVEPLAAFLVATALASALFWTAKVVPLVADNLHGAIAVVFLYVPWLAARLARRSFDYGEAGLTVRPVGTNLRVCGVAVLVTWPLFFIAFLVFYGTACRPNAPALLGYWAETFAPICHRWLGLSEVTLRLPPKFLLLALSQLLVVAVPEELFFRGYLWQRLEERWPSRVRVLGAEVGPTLLVTSGLFALGHVLVDFDPQRFAVFFPGLVFGWMRARAGSLAAGALFHALCNLLSDVLHTSFFK